jgi:hypothetical protein
MVQRAATHSILILILSALLCPAALAGSASDKKQPVAEDEIASADLATYFKVKKKLEKKSAESIERLQLLNGDKAKYTPEEVKSYQKDETDAQMNRTLKQLEASSGYQGPKTFPWVSLRRSYTDVLTGEDPSLQGNGAKSFDDLNGALFSYARDFQGKADTWSAEMAVLAPFSFVRHVVVHTDDPFRVTRFGFTPSFSLHRVTSNGDPKNEVDQQTYRVGSFLKLESGYPVLERLTFRGYATYAKDNTSDMSVPAAEFDIEPQCDFSNRLRIGYRTVLGWKIDPEAFNADPQTLKKAALVAYQFRAILHGQYGAVQNDGPKFTGMEYHFFRLGPKLQLDIDPIFFDQLHGSVFYEYQPALSGQNPNDTFFSASLTWDLLKDSDNRRRLGLTVDYTDGGLELTAAKVRTLKVSLNAAF